MVLLGQKVDWLPCIHPIHHKIPIIPERLEDKISNRLTLWNSQPEDMIEWRVGWRYLTSNYYKIIYIPL